MPSVNKSFKKPFSAFSVANFVVGPTGWVNGGTVTGLARLYHLRAVLEAGDGTSSSSNDSAETSDSPSLSKPQQISSAVRVKPRKSMWEYR